MTLISSAEQRRWRRRVFAITWLTYAGFYLCRKNISVVLPLMERDLGYSNLQVADVIFVYSLSYTLGQFVCGVLSDRFGPRLIVGTGVFVTIVANVLLGFQSTLVALSILACLNGAGQSAGWSGLVKNMACWFRRRERGVVMAWWSTNYVLGGFAATIFATFVATNPGFLPGLGWRRGFWAPAMLLFLIALAFVLWDRNRPADVGLPAVDEDGNDVKQPARASSRPLSAQQNWDRSAWTFRALLSDPAIWTVGTMFFFLTLTRYAFLFWLPLYMTQHLGYSTVEAGYTSSLFELVGISGAIIAGYTSEKLFQSRRFPVGAIMMWGLALVSLVHPFLAALGQASNALGISLIGIMTYGPDTLMSGAAAQDLGSAEGAATASGFIDGVGHFGQILSPFVVAFVTSKYGWDVLFYVFVVFALIGGGLLATKWNYKADRPVASEP